MTAARPYYLLGQKQLGLLAEQVQSALAPLTSRWWPADCRLQINAIDNFYPGDDLCGASARYVARRDGRWLALFGRDQDWLALAEGWLGCRVATQSELVQTLWREFCRDVFCALADVRAAGANSRAANVAEMHSAQINSAAIRSLEIDSSEINSPEIDSDVPWRQLPAEILQPGAGTLRLAIDIDGIGLQMLASPTLWPDLAKTPSVRSQIKLTPCNAALGACRVQVSAALPVAQIPLTDVAALAVGDFLNLGHDLSGRVQLRGENIQLAVPALVGRRQSQKAIQLTAPATAPSTAAQNEKNT